MKTSWKHFADDEAARKTAEEMVVDGKRSWADAQEQDEAARKQATESAVWEKV